MSSEFLASLQTLRFFAALAVAQYHLWLNFFGVFIGHPGTDFFLVLVGVISAYALSSRIPEIQWRDYLKSRYIRLYAPYLPLFLFAALAKRDEADVELVVRSFLFIPVPDGSPLIGATWMLSMFMLFYFLFSLAFLAGSEKILWLVFGIWLILILTHRFWGWNTGLPRHWEQLLFSLRNVNFVLGYGAGIVLRNHWLKNRWALILMWTGLAAVAGGTVWLNLEARGIERMLFVSLPVAAFVLGIAALEQQDGRHWMVRLLTRPWLVWLGGTSYFIYLSHGILFQFWAMVLPVSIGWILPMTLGAVVAGSLGYIFWEYPAMNYLHGREWRLPRLPAN
jgi:peptidoglycan/LPS O-acetylase OafA/YrhL